MSIILKVTEAELVRMAADISTQIAEIEKQFAQIENEISLSQSYWEGDASNVHKRKFEALKSDIAGTMQTLKAQPDKLIRMAGIYRSNEMQAIVASQSLRTDIFV